MPVSTLSAERLRALLPISLTDVALDDLVFLSKAEIEVREGDELRLSATPDRLDLLTEAGFALYLSGAAGVASGLVHPREESPDPALRVSVEPSVVPLRPYLAALVVRSPDPTGLDEGTLAEAIRFQELIHATLGRNRRAASLGIYPLERLTPPFQVLPRTDGRGTDSSPWRAPTRSRPPASMPSIRWRRSTEPSVVRATDVSRCAIPAGPS